MEKSTAADARQLREMLMRSPVFTSGVVTIASAIGAVFIWARPGTKKIRRTLRKRILEELKDERAFVWRYIYDETEVLAICERIHDGRYTWERPPLKAGTTEIIWIPAPKLSDPEILMVEADGS